MTKEAKKVTITFLREEPEVIDTITADGVFIERMDDGYYFMVVHDNVFAISTKKRGRCIITKERGND